jgi:hypothetical protein
VIRSGRVLPEAPTRFDDYTYGDVPAHWVIVNDWLLLPPEPSTRPCPYMFDAVIRRVAACLFRDLTWRDLLERAATLERLDRCAEARRFTASGVRLGAASAAGT